MTRAAVCLALALSACGTFIDPDMQVQNFAPYAMLITEPAQYEHDRETCVTVAMAYQHPLSVTGVGIATVQGAASNAGGAAINPLVAASGAAGGATNEVLNGLGLTTADRMKIVAKCMTHLGDESKAYVIVDPND